VAHRDPFPQVAGGGLDQLERAGLAVEVGLLESQVRHLNAPYLKLVEQGRPWVIAKWAMTLDGKIATCAGDSRWISGEASRTRVHQMRGRVDAIVVGYRTAVADDPLLTARPSGPRIATRIVVDPRAGLPLRSRLARTARETPVLIAVDATASDQNRRHLFEAGCEVWGTESLANATGLTQLLEELGRRRMTNVVVEGGGRLLGRLFDAQLIDEVHVFIASKLVGGADAPSPVAGFGIERMSQAVRLVDPQFEHLDGDLYLHGRLQVNP
jgi:diaminohydroxyphosphoribosylaminopyrimidine deaminase/5-amino-6-(5-phosphoribosylamino)uracil reductase